MNDELNGCHKSDSEPAASHAPVPVWIFALMLVLLFLGAVYFDYHSGWFDKQVYAPYPSANELALYQPKSGAAAMAAHGKAVYETVCGICHGADGLGKPGQAPPLAGSEWVARDVLSLARVPLSGLNGTIQVKGQQWNLSMAPMGAGLSDADLAAVLSYIRTSWGNNYGAVSADELKATRAAISGNVPSAAASISTFDRIGIVLRRSTTDWTWDRHRSSVARSIVAFMTVSCPPSAGDGSRPPALNSDHIP